MREVIFICALANLRKCAQRKQLAEIHNNMTPETENKMRVLIVDDEWGMREGSKRILLAEGFDVDIAESGATARAIAAQKIHDIYLLDLKLPDVDGITLLDEFHTQSPNSVFLIVTAYATLDAAVEATRKGAFDFVAKPFTPQQLRQVVNRVAERRRLLLEAERLRKEREERLMELATERTRTKSILSTLREGVLVVNTRGEIVLYNGIALTMLQLSKLDVGSQLAPQLPESKLKDAVLELLQLPENEENEKLFEVEGLAEGQMFSVYATPVPSKDGSEAGRTIILQDVTHQAELDRAKSNFVRIVSHEIKAPVAAVIGFTDMILQGYVTEEEKKTEYLMRSKRRLEGLIDMVKDLLSITRAEAAELKGNFSPLDFGALVKEVVSSLESSALEKKLTVVLELGEIPPIAADETAMMQLITNLVSNAIKYNKDEGTVTVCAHIAGDGVELTVADTGIGIPKSAVATIFDPFFRVKSDATKKIQGTGLGLAIAQRVVKMHRGRIDIESEVGMGTKFIVWLPAERK